MFFCLLFFSYTSEVQQLADYLFFLAIKFSSMIDVVFFLGFIVLLAIHFYHLLGHI